MFKLRVGCSSSLKISDQQSYQDHHPLLSLILKDMLQHHHGMPISLPLIALHQIILLFHSILVESLIFVVASTNLKHHLST